MRPSHQISRRNFHPLSTNQWLFIASNPVAGTISCDSSHSMINVTFQNIWTLQPRCRCYTLSTVLSSTSKQTSNFTNYSPPVDITADNCCMEEQEFMDYEEMERIKLTNLNLNELHQAQGKLQQFDEELKIPINQLLRIFPKMLLRQRMSLSCMY